MKNGYMAKTSDPETAVPCSQLCNCFCELLVMYWKAGSIRTEGQRTKMCLNYTSAKDKENMKLHVKVCWACCVRTDVSVSFLDPNSHADRLWPFLGDYGADASVALQHVAQREPLLPPCTTFVHMFWTKTKWAAYGGSIFKEYCKFNAR